MLKPTIFRRCAFSFRPTPLPPNDKHVLVIGAGVIGSSTAFELLERGYKVTMVSKQWARLGGSMQGDQSFGVTSEIAGALWEFPPWYCGRHNTGVPMCKPKRWALESFDRFQVLSKMLDKKETGVYMKPCYCYFDGPILDLQDEVLKYPVLQQLPNFRHSPDVIKEQDISTEDYIKVVDAYVHDAPMMEMEDYMRFLYSQLDMKGCNFVSEKIDGMLIDQLSTLKAKHSADVVVNCTGLGAKDLTGDEHVYPIRGSVLKIRNDGELMPKLTCSMNVAFMDWVYPKGHADESNLLVYFVPRGDDYIWIGATIEPDYWDRNVDLSHERIQALFKKAKQFYPPLRAFQDSDIVEVLTDLRPGRREDIRVEEDSEAPTLVHNYGHAGAGVIMSWGSAVECADIVDRV